MTIFDRLHDRITTTNSILSIGLDPIPDRLPPAVQNEPLPRFAFNQQIIDATHEYAAAYKPNAAFYESPSGWRSLERTITYAHDHDVPVILDAKRSDIAHTASQYAEALSMADAITVTPYLGADSLQPFFARDDAAVFVVCHTTNPGRDDYQTAPLTDGPTLAERVADDAADWHAEYGDVGLVVGATTPDTLAQFRDRVPDLPFLVPGIGAQDGDCAAAATAAPATNGVGLVNATRSIIYAGMDTPTEFDTGAARAAHDLQTALHRHYDPATA